ncbi:MAG: hypothetical protein ACREID_02755, partial [Planctomycetota bacterium]
MNRELIDFLLGELPPERAREMEELHARDVEASRERDRYQKVCNLVRAAAAEGWDARVRARPRLLRPLLAAAALVAAAVGAFFLNGGGP